MARKLRFGPVQKGASTILKVDDDCAKSIVRLFGYYDAFVDAQSEAQALARFSRHGTVPVYKHMLTDITDNCGLFLELMNDRFPESVTQRG